MRDSLKKWIEEYENTELQNTFIYTEFTKLTDTISWLKFHRDTIEKNKWGFGDRAFHYMWYLILLDTAQRFDAIQCLEVGVYKGQILSLWSLISNRLNIYALITGVSPLDGNIGTSASSKILRKLRYLFDPKYRKSFDENRRVGNLHEKVDYKAIIKEVYLSFNLEFNSINLIKGFSADPPVIRQLQNKLFHIVYIDGDHSFKGASADITIYAPLVPQGGYLIMDDASFFLPGKGYFKGIESVSLACETLTSFGFTNVLNVGHNRVYLKI